MSKKLSVRMKEDGQCPICNKDLVRYEAHVQEYHVECSGVGCSFDLRDEDWDTLRANMMDRENSLALHMAKVLRKNGVDDAIINIAILVGEASICAD